MVRGDPRSLGSRLLPVVPSFVWVAGWYQQSRLDLERLLPLFANASIETRYFAAPEPEEPAAPEGTRPQRKDASRRSSILARASWRIHPPRSRPSSGGAPRSGP